MDRLFLAAKSTGKTRTETLMGRDYRVTPAVLVQEQVLTNNLGATFLPAEAITDEWAAAANGAPVVLGHPTVSGKPVSARDPLILNTRGAGFLYRARVDNKRLLADVFIDPELAANVTGLPAILEKMDRGDPVELSTGFPVAIVEKAGVHNGKKYDRVLTPAGFDHLAVFAKATDRGACSVDDGCGLGVNSESDDERRTKIDAALSEKFGREAWIVALFSDDGFVVFYGSGSRKMYKATFSIDDAGVVTLGDAEEVARVTTYEPVQAGNMDPRGKEPAGLLALIRRALGREGIDPPAEPNTDNRGGEMEREAIIAELAEADIGLNAAALGKLADCELAAMRAKVAARAAAPAPAENAEAVTLLRSIDDRLRAVENASRATMEADAAERTRLVTELADNARVAFPRADLEAMTTEHLRRLRATVRGEDYLGQGGPMRADNEGDRDGVLPVVPYFAGRGGEA